MARGNTIIVTADPKGTFLEGIVSGTPKPGTCMEISSFTLVGGRFTWQVYQPGTDGDRRLIAILLPQDESGQLVSTAYESGQSCKLYVPIAGEEFNMLLKDVSGTGDDHTAGETLIVDTGTGLLIATTGSPESEPFRLLETVTDPTSDTLAWCMYTGY